jgi:serine/threonine protein kinase
MFDHEEYLDTEFFPKRGSRLNRYTVLDIAAPEGGTAVVLTCKDTGGNLVAVKRFKKNSLNQKMIERILEEIKLPIQSKYLVFARQAFEEGGYLHSVLPLIEGKSLGEILEFSNGMTEPEVVQIGISLAEAAGDLHHYGIISADIKPSNIMITQQQLKLVDLTCFERIGLPPEISLGTNPYAAPELEQRNILTAATDVYSIGVVLYEALTGSEFLEQNGLEVTVIRERYPRLSRIIQQATEYIPGNRYADTRSLIMDLNSGLNAANIDPMCCLTLANGQQFFMPPGKYVLGRDDIDPGNPYISARQIELDFTGSSARIRDVACKNKIFMGNITVDGTWSDIPCSSMIRIANIKLRIEVK